MISDIHTNGGILKVSFDYNGKYYKNIWLSGKAEMVYTGKFEC